MMEKEELRRDDTFLYLRSIRQPMAIRGLADLPGRTAMRSHYPTFPDQELVRPGLRQSLAGEQEWGCMYDRSRLRLHETTYDSKDPHSRNLFEGNRYDASFSWNHQLGNKVAIARTLGCGGVRVRIGEAYTTSWNVLEAHDPVGHGRPHDIVWHNQAIPCTQGNWEFRREFLMTRLRREMTQCQSHMSYCIIWSDGAGAPPWSLIPFPWKKDESKVRHFPN
jgi:hypothetical protein